MDKILKNWQNFEKSAKFWKIDKILKNWQNFQNKKSKNISDDIFSQKYFRNILLKLFFTLWNIFTFWRLLKTKKIFIAKQKYFIDHIYIESKIKTIVTVEVSSSVSKNEKFWKKKLKKYFWQHIFTKIFQKYSSKIVFYTLKHFHILKTIKVKKNILFSKKIFYW